MKKSLAVTLALGGILVAVAGGVAFVTTGPDDAANGSRGALPVPAAVIPEPDAQGSATTTASESLNGQWFQHEGLPVVVADRTVCSLINDDATAASIEAFDVVGSVVASGKTFWLFGDAYLTEPAWSTPMVQAPVAVSADIDASDCVSMKYKASEGRAQALFPRREGETVAWPTGAISVENGYVSFYFARVYRESPTEWHVGQIGLGRFDTGTMNGERVMETLWDASSGFGESVNGARSPVRLGNDVFVFLHTARNRHIVARVPADSLADPDAYSYWDGVDWSAEAANAKPLWPEPASALPTHDGVSVQYNEFLGKWIALYSRDLSRLRVRLADALTGPWSPAYEWLNCSQAFEPVWPVCYSAEQNLQLTRDGGRTLYVSLSTSYPYTGWLLELRLGVPIRQWRDEAGERYYSAVAPGQAYGDEGVAFYAADMPVPGFSPIYAWRASDERIYSASSPGSDFIQAGTAFFAPTSQELPGSTVRYDAVYRWDAGKAHIFSPMASGLEKMGYTRGPVAFYAVCGDADLNGMSDCVQAGR